MNRVAVINVVGLTKNLIGPITPNLQRLAAKLPPRAIDPALPAVTCTAQSNYLTGKGPTEHGIVANGWYNRELAEVQFWKQPNQLVQSPKIWEELKGMNPSFTCAKLFWWYNMYAEVDYSITPRPMYPADGRKVFDIYTSPFPIREEIKKDLGAFPFPCFWGPAAGKHSPQGGPDAVSQWIAGSAKWIEERHSPTLSLIYLPHLDYNLQRFGSTTDKIKPDLVQIDKIVGDLINFFESRHVQPILLSEYGITNVDKPVHLNRIFRQQGWIAIKEELGLEQLDYGASKVFAVADHQIAHIYCNDSSIKSQVRRILESIEEIDFVLDSEEKESQGLNHSRAGDLIAVSKENAWFTYYFWEEDNKAPDFARTIDIHRKPGYDPVELFIDPEIRFPKLRIATRLAQKKMGMRMLMDLIPLDADLVKGSHGCRPSDIDDWPIIMAASERDRTTETLKSTDVYQVIKNSVLGI